MIIKQFTFNPLGENTYLIWDTNTFEAAIIDCGAFNVNEKNTLSTFIHENGLQLKYSLLTHAHFDHIFGVSFIKEEFGIAPTCHIKEEKIYKEMPLMAMQFGIKLQSPMPQIEAFVDENITLQIGEIEINVLHTPGHTPGGICFYIPKERILFSGDTLFYESIGRADLPEGNYQQEIESIRNKLFILPADTCVYPGHGPSTTIEWEKTNNMYFR